ncbi:hypothetical protein EST38_g12552 [Candolleomyces aberdarensis]|uniref:Uncharacterized protein n=1 Tax=Candolleomyces aberdarensis TaxID=2316362 RepID=A0A4Q2D4C8_9AGAR|nr:hypothetical protein EST38_g12552 [Candolleomyces aberdarensis]
MLLSASDKSLRGFNHPQLGRLLCPIEHVGLFDSDPVKFKQEKEAGQILVVASKWPAFLFPFGYKYSPSTVYNNVFAGEMIPRGCNALLVGDSTTFGGTSTSKNPSTAVKHNILEVNGLIASYIVMHYRNAMSSQSKFSITDGLFELDDFYRNCCKLLVDDDPLAGHILQKINSAVVDLRQGPGRQRNPSSVRHVQTEDPVAVLRAQFQQAQGRENQQPPSEPSQAQQPRLPISSARQQQQPARANRHQPQNTSGSNCHPPQHPPGRTGPHRPNASHPPVLGPHQANLPGRSVNQLRRQPSKIIVPPPASPQNEDSNPQAPGAIDDTSDDEYFIGPNPRRSAQTSQTLRRVMSPEPPLHDDENDDEDLSQPAPISQTLRRTVSREPALHDEDDDDMYGDDPEAGEYLDTSRTGHREQQDLGSNGEDFQSDDNEEDTTPTLPPNLQKIMYVALSLLESGSVSKAEKFFETAINLCQDPDLLAMMLEIWTTKRVTLTRKASIVSPSPERTLQTTPQRTPKHLGLIPAAFTPRPPSTPWNNLPAGSATPQPPPIPPTPHTPAQDLTQGQKRSSNTLDGRNDQEVAPTNTVKRRKLPKASAPATRVQPPRGPSKNHSLRN